jgi:two-component system, OmpR family, response regulator VicR
MKLILVVEDEPTIAELIGNILEAEGYEVVHAQHGRRALQLIQAQRPNLIITDLMMPVMDGWAFLRAIQADPTCHAIPIILTSAALSDGIATEGLRSWFLAKPFEIDDLLHLVSTLLGP